MTSYRRKFFFAFLFLHHIIAFSQEKPVSSPYPSLRLLSTQSLCTGSLGDPVVNISFGNGPGPGQPLQTIVPGASTSYNFVSTSGNPAAPVPFDGNYTIANNVPVNPSWFQSQPDHTPGDVNGYLAFFNASETPGEFYKQTVTGLCGNTKYEFAAWVGNVLNPASLIGIKPDITFTITKLDGTVLASYATGAISQKTTFTWEQFGFFFATPTGVNSVILKMTNNNPGGNAQPGNDLAIDDITFRPCGPTLSPSFSSSSLQTTKNQCGNQEVQLFGSVSSAEYINPSYLWQISLDKGSTWTDLPTSNTLNYLYTPPNAGSFLFRMLTAESSNINAVQCRIISYTISLKIQDSPQGSFAGGEICEGNAGKLSFISTKGVPPFNIQYTDGTDIYVASQLNSSGFFTSINPASTIDYTLVSVNDGNGCITTSGFTNPVATVTVKSKPIVTLTPASSICVGDSIQLMAAGGTLYSWSPSSGLNSTIISNPKAAPNTNTNYLVTVANGICTSTASISITVKPKPIITVSPNVSVCKGDSVQLTSSGGTLYSWSPCNGLNNSTIANPKSSPTSNTIYSLTVGDESGCYDSANVTVTVNTKPTVTTTPDATLCKSDTLQLIASGADNYQWLPGTGLSNSFISNPKAAPGNNIIYKVIGTTKQGCKDSADLNITVINKPALYIGNDTVICANTNLSLNASTAGASLYQWNTGHTTPVINVSSGGVYIVNVEANGCKIADSIKVNQIQAPSILLGNDTTICNFQTFSLNAAGKNIVTYLWNNGITDSVIYIQKSGLYAVTVGNQCGTAADEINVKVDICSNDIFFPSAFTPNNDMLNDKFKALFFVGVELYNYELHVFNRWGALVYTTKSPTAGWDGLYKGQMQKSDVYVWYAKYSKEINGKLIKRKGTVTLIK
jgi:gliding motility-associated-like protein